MILSLLIRLGLDPAGPLFTYPILASHHQRLIRQDAEYVQCVHTNCGLLGSPVPCGDSDYYPNFCRRQPGCANDACDHERAIGLFDASLNPAYQFDARKCDSEGRARLNLCANQIDRLGIYAKRLNGQFYFPTAECYPFV